MPGTIYENDTVYYVRMTYTRYRTRERYVPYFEYIRVLCCFGHRCCCCTALIFGWRNKSREDKRETTWYYIVWSYLLFLIVSSWGNIPLQSCWSLFRDHVLHCSSSSHDFMWEQQHIRLFSTLSYMVRALHFIKSQPTGYDITTTTLPRE